MSEERAEPVLSDNPAESRYEALVGDFHGMIEYELAEGTIIFTHTEVDPELEGQGVAGKMARFALDDARRRGLKVVPDCPFVAAYIKRHPEYSDLVAEE
jgi:hypothetical protein